MVQHKAAPGTFDSADIVIEFFNATIKNGAHWGHWEVQVKLYIKKGADGVEWGKDALQEISLSVDGSHELDKAQGEESRTEFKFSGKGEMKGKDAGKIEQRAETTVKVKEGSADKKSG